MRGRYIFIVSLCLALSVMFLFSQHAVAQYPVKIGEGSVASFPPGYKAKSETSNGAGFNATSMLSRKIYVDEMSGENIDGFDAPGRPIPTNDWWTDIINSRFSGALWSYPAMLNTSESGVTVYWPSYWADQGKEIKSKSSLTVGGYRFLASETAAKDWHDWDVVFRMPSVEGKGELTVTSVHGSPFTWFEYEGIDPEIFTSASAVLFGESSGYVGIRIGDDLYGIYYPAAARPLVDGNSIRFSLSVDWIAVALLRDETDLKTFSQYAASIPRSTKVEWSYDESTARVSTVWTVTAENLRSPGAPAPVLQGFLPHAYKYALPGASLSFIDEEGYMTPRGKMKTAVSSDGTFSYSYRFSGMLPTYAPPAEGAGFQSEVMEKLMTDYADKGSFGGDTYWGGKGLVQMAMNMSFAKETGNKEIYERSKSRLKEALTDWLTYTPGEDTFFFSYYPRWGGMLGFDVSYDSDAFNDHHFHFGYFTYAAALLCLEDREFAKDYGNLLTLIAKDYANWDRADNRFPFMRTIDPWCGHSWAGGLGDAGNDNGNGQESSSEAMQGWGGVYLLGVALDNREMRDAGLWGWNTEARATREYWFDVDAPRASNAGGRKEWPGKGSREGNYRFDEYPYAYNSNITGKGIGWWTWFGGDPLYMHGIQWMPVSPALDYLSWDPDFVAWAYDDLMRGANSSFSHSWFENTTNTDNGETIQSLATNDWGGVVLSYLQRTDPQEAARIFDQALDRGMHIATSVGTSHISYYVTHSHLCYGEPNFGIHADIPTAQVWEKDGQPTWMVYNPSPADREVNFYDENGARVKTVNAPAERLAAISADPTPTTIECGLKENTILAPGESIGISTKVTDQYGAEMKKENVSFSLSPGAPAVIVDDNLKIDSDAPLGTTFNVILTSGDLKEDRRVTVNNRPEGVGASIEGLPSMCERNTAVSPRLLVVDQYGEENLADDAVWIVTPPDGVSESKNGQFQFLTPGKYIVEGSSPEMKISARQEVAVLPTLPVISGGAETAASSAENAGTMPSGINDGNETTRWGSSHEDNQWIVIDLGEDCFVSKIGCLWEAAYASRYLLETAPDGCPTQTLTVSYAGQSKTVTVPVEEAWTVTADERIGSAGLHITPINDNARYVRLRGLDRATQYGISLYEVSISGLRLSEEADKLIGIDFNLPEVMDRGKAHNLSPVGYTASLQSVKPLSLQWTADKSSIFTGDYFTPQSNGTYTIRATAPGGVYTEGTVFVNDVERAASVSFDRQEYTVAAGERLKIGFTVNNQYFAPYTGDLSSISIKVTDQSGNPSTAASFDVENRIFRSAETGDFLITFGTLGSCRVKVVDISQINLALGRPVYASTEKDGNAGSRAVDGRLDSRWESAWEDNQWLEVELDALYMVDRMKINWEGAYAKEYTVEFSADGINWTEVYRQPSGKGGTEEISFAATAAKYVRLNCMSRALSAYGFSIYELEIYGREKLTDEEEDLGVAEVDGESGAARWFELNGTPVDGPAGPGLYLRVAGGKAEKVLVR